MKHPLEISPTMDKSPSYKCDVCNINFDKKKELKEHIKALNHESDLNKMICEYCNKTLSSERKYNQHILKFHAKGHTCKLCNQSFDDKKVTNIISYRVSLKLVPLRSLEKAGSYFPKPLLNSKL